jgi:bifunctional non-homologous end joining protein LigD
MAAPGIYDVGRARREWGFPASGAAARPDTHRFAAGRAGKVRHLMARAPRRDSSARDPDPKVLSTYRRKRNFERTSEPSRESVASPDSPTRRFVVQRHRARRLHYDFRLEIDGVLVSWAVPKGVTLDPAARHLAIHVEDHPLEYADFEGVVPGGEYGGGDVIVWDRGTWELHGADDARQAVEAGEVHAELHGEKLRGRVVLVRTGAAKDNREQWIVLHKRDADAVTGWDPEDHPLSVISGRDNDEVASNRERVWTREGEAPGPPPPAQGC